MPRGSADRGGVGAGGGAGAPRKAPHDFKLPDSFPLPAPNAPGAAIKFRHGKGAGNQERLGTGLIAHQEPAQQST